MRDLGIGRTPLREAVKRLALENLVAVQPRSGTTSPASTRPTSSTSPRSAPSWRRTPPSSRHGASTASCASGPRHCSTRYGRSSGPTREALMGLDEASTG